MARSTVRIDDDLMQELKARARREDISLTRVLNRLLRTGITASRGNKRKTSHHKASGAVPRQLADEYTLYTLRHATP